MVPLGSLSTGVIFAFALINQMTMSQGYRDFLAFLLAEEVAHRKQTACNVLPARPTSPSSRPLTSSTSVCRRHCIRLPARFLPRAGFCQRGPLADFLCQGRSWENSPGCRHRLSRHPEWLRDLEHQRRKTRGRAFQCRQAGTLTGIIANLHASSRFDCRRGWFLNLRSRCRQCFVSCGQQSPLEKATDDFHHE